jgi:hypothetical protein
MKKIGFIGNTKIPVVLKSSLVFEPNKKKPKKPKKVEGK